MRIEFHDRDLARLYHDTTYNGGSLTGVIRSFREKVRMLLRARDERDLWRLPSLAYKRLKGDRSDQWAIRLNGPWRLIMRRRETNGVPVLILLEIVNYH